MGSGDEVDKGPPSQDVLADRDAYAIGRDYIVIINNYPQLKQSAHQAAPPDAGTAPAAELLKCGDQDHPQDVLPGQADLIPEQFAILRDAVATFGKFVAIEDSPGSFSGGDPNTVVLLHLPEVDQRLGQLAKIGFVDVPDVRWANRLAGAVVRARECSRGFRGYTANEHERDALRDAIRELRNLITDQYPGLLRGLRRVEKEPERIGEFTLEVRERGNVGAPWTRETRHRTDDRPSSVACQFQLGERFSVGWPSVRGPAVAVFEPLPGTRVPWPAAPHDLIAEQGIGIYDNPIVNVVCLRIQVIRTYLDVTDEDSQSPFPVIEAPQMVRLRLREQGVSVPSG